MRLCVLIPSQGYLALAGARIRYHRIQKHLADDGAELTFTVLDDFKKDESLDSDVYIFSKCYDARSVVLANVLRGAGKLIGIDLFDDYFSQPFDGRFEHLRETTRAVAPMLDFALCSTARMEEVAQKLVPDRPCHTLNDPYDSFDPDNLAMLLEKKIERARSESRISVCWFGNGDNDYFPVGLRDLTAFCGEIRRLMFGSFEPHLTVLTNRTALSTASLRMLKRIAVPFEVEEWSQDAEKAILKDSLVCFLPVTGQEFSIAKSLNRCVSALTRGAQVLSSGYPLYEPFDDFLYRHPRNLVRDVESGRLALRRETVGEFARALEHWSSPEREARNLAQFLHDALAKKREGESAAVSAPTEVTALLHGAHTSGASHKLAQKHGHLSIGTPFSPPSLGYDADFRVTDASLLEMTVGRRAIPLLDQSLAPLLKDAVFRTGRPAKALDLSALGVAKMPAHLQACSASKLQVLASYGSFMAMLEETAGRAFPSVRTYVSEHRAYLVASRLPIQT